MDKYKNISTFDELLEVEYGTIGTDKRNDFEQKSQMFIVSEMLKEARKDANLTQDQLAIMSGTKKAISLKLKMAREIFNYRL